MNLYCILNNCDYFILYLICNSCSFFVNFNRFIHYIYFIYIYIIVTKGFLIIYNLSFFLISIIKQYEFNFYLLLKHLNHPSIHFLLSIYYTNYQSQLVQIFLRFIKFPLIIIYDLSSHWYYLIILNYLFHDFLIYDLLTLIKINMNVLQIIS